jgi:HAD superfamily phosphoserine phosphatase-like hydrolase
MTDETNQLSPTPVLVSDFDGTMTRHDFYQLAVERLVPPGTPYYWGEYLAGRLTHFEALRRVFASIRANEAALLETAEMMAVDADLPAAITRLQQAGWSVMLASAGCDWYIQRLLAARNIDIVVHDNPGTFAEAHGLMMALPSGSPYYTESTGISKEAVVREMLRTHACVAFAGDGRPDLPAALLVPPARRFARGWLAEYLLAEGIPFQPLTQWSVVATQLLEGVGTC